jgi:hypothetical protein
MKSVFGDEWRACLRAHYQHTVRQDDRVALTTLIPILEGQMGFSSDELRQLYIEATMRADEIDFVPDPDLVDVLTAPEAAPASASETPTFQPHPLECQCPACVAINLTPHDADGQPLDADALAELEAREAAKNHPDAPKQLSLF